MVERPLTTSRAKALPKALQGKLRLKKKKSLSHIRFLYAVYLLEYEELRLEFLFSTGEILILETFYQMKAKCKINVKRMSPIRLHKQLLKDNMASGSNF